MTGPSSSHTAAPCRIGKAVSLLWGERVQRADVVFDAAGSYPSTYIGQGSDMGFTGGLMGFLPEDPNLRCALDFARQQKRDIRFTTGKLSSRHPNEARLDIWENDGRCAMSVLSFSTGGGSFRLVELDGFPISYDGCSDRFYLAVSPGLGTTAARATLQTAGVDFCVLRADPCATTFPCFPAASVEEAVLLEVEGSALTPELRASLAAGPEVFWARDLPHISPVVHRAGAGLPFTDAAGALARAKDTGEDMSALALAYECAWGLICPDEVRRQMAGVLEVMRQSASPVPAGYESHFRMVIPKGGDLLYKAVEAPVLDLGAMEKSAAMAVSVLENSSARRRIVAAPTAGSSGVLPGTVVCLGDALGCSDDAMIDALLAAGLVGSFISNNATFAAESAGCQAEIGSAACMAAAGVVQLLGGTIDQGFAAASLAMQHYLGLICDPVAGCAEVPCIARNALAASAAVTAAVIAMHGFDAIIPLDEAVTAMAQVGRTLPDSLRCTCRGGLCLTPTGQQIQKRVSLANAADGVASSNIHNI